MHVWEDFPYVGRLHMIWYIQYGMSSKLWEAFPNMGGPPTYACDVFPHMYIYTHMRSPGIFIYTCKTSHTYIHTWEDFPTQPIESKHCVFAWMHAWHEPGKKMAFCNCAARHSLCSLSCLFAVPTTIQHLGRSLSGHAWRLSAKQACMGSMLKSLAARDSTHGVSSKLHQTFGGSVCGPRALY